MRQFISETPLDAHGTLTIRGNDFVHVCRVLRSSIGDMVQVRFPDGSLVPMTVCALCTEKKTATLQRCACDYPAGSAQNEIKHAITYTLFQCIAKPQKMELIIRQATECGVATIVPVIGAYSQKGCIEAMRAKYARFEKIIKEAREQSGSPRATVLHEPVAMSDVCMLWRTLQETLCEKQMTQKEQRAMSVQNVASARGGAFECADDVQKNCESSLALVLSERNEKCKPLSKIVGKCGDIKHAALVVGSEGGISPDEIALLCAGSFVPVHFPGNILRCETAALYGIAALQTHLVTS